jgi:trigger factor
VATQEPGEFEFVDAPTFDVAYKGDCAYEVKVVIPASNTLKQSQEMFQELQGDAELPGFRRGKAPRKLLERKYGKAVRGEATEKLVSAAFRKLIKGEDLKPIDYPDVEGLENLSELPADAPLDFTLKFEVAPRVTLGNYKGIAVERPVLAVGDKEVDEALTSMRQRYAAYETIEDGTAQDEDQVIIDFTGTINGEAFAGGSAENYPYILGSGRFFKEFEEAIRGAKSGADVSCDVSFPDTYHGADVAGKTAQFAIKINEIKRRTMPEVDEKFAETAGFESVEKMREAITKDLQAGADNQGREIAEQRAIQAVVEASTFEIPKSLIDSSAEVYYKQELRRLITLRVPTTELDEKEAELRKQAEEHALREIKGYVVIGEIGRTEKVEVLDEDFEKEAEAIMSRTGMDIDIAKRFLDQDDKRSDYEERIYRKKAVAAIMESAKVTEKKVTREELEKDSADA